MLKKLICFLSIAFAIALVAKSVIFILAIMGGAKLDAECINWLVELGISWLVVLVAAVAFIFKLFEEPKTIRVPFPIPVPVHDDDDKPEDNDPEKPEGDDTPEDEKPEDEKPEGGTEEKPEGTEDKPE